MADFHNSLRFHLIYMTILPPEKHRFILVEQLNENKSGCETVNSTGAIRKIMITSLD